MDSKTQEKSDYSYVWLMVLTIVCWGIVPGFAKLGSLAGDVTTMWVNIVAVVALSFIVLIKGYWRLFHQYTWNDYLSMIGIGIIWPLTYSFSYFFSIYFGSPSLTTVLNYMWPLFYLIFAVWLLNEQVRGRSTLFVIFAVFAVICVTLLSGTLQATNFVATIILGVGAAITQALFYALSNRYKYEPWVLIFMIEVVTALGSTVWVISRGGFSLPGINSLFYLALIGVFGNAIGFWSFMSAGQKSRSIGEVAETTVLMGLCLVPLVAIVLLPFMGAEHIDGWKLLGAVVIAAGLIYYRRTTSKTKEEVVIKQIVS